MVTKPLSADAGRFVLSLRQTDLEADRADTGRDVLYRAIRIESPSGKFMFWPSALAAIIHDGNASPILRIGNLLIWAPSLSHKERETTPPHDRLAAPEMAEESCPDQIGKRVRIKSESVSG